MYKARTGIRISRVWHFGSDAFASAAERQGPEQSAAKPAVEEAHGKGMRIGDWGLGRSGESTGGIPTVLLFITNPCSGGREIVNNRLLLKADN
jgi:hypothetical protein